MKKIVSISQTIRNFSKDSVVDYDLNNLNQDKIKELFKNFSIGQLMKIKHENTNLFMFLLKKEPNFVSNAINTVYYKNITEVIADFCKNYVPEYNWKFQNLRQVDDTEVDWSQIISISTKHIDDAISKQDIDSYKTNLLNKETADKYIQNLIQPKTFFDKKINNLYIRRENDLRNSKMVQKLFYLRFLKIMNIMLEEKYLTENNYDILSVGGGYSISCFEAVIIKTSLQLSGKSGTIYDIDKNQGTCNVNDLRNEDMKKHQQIYGDSIKLMTGNATEPGFINTIPDFDIMLIINPPIIKLGFVNTIKVSYHKKKISFQCPLAKSTFQNKKDKLYLHDKYIKNALNYMKDKNKKELIFITTAYYKKDIKIFIKSAKTLINKNKYSANIFNITFQDKHVNAFSWYSKYLT